MLDILQHIQTVVPAWVFAVQIHIPRFALPHIILRLCIRTKYFLYETLLIDYLHMSIETFVGSKFGKD